MVSKYKCSLFSLLFGLDVSVPTTPTNLCSSLSSVHLVLLTEIIPHLLGSSLFLFPLLPQTFSKHFATFEDLHSLPFVYCPLMKVLELFVEYLTNASLPLLLWRQNRNISIGLKKNKWHGADLSYSQGNLLDIVLSCLLHFQDCMTINII